MTTIAQLRTGYCGRNHYIFRFNINRSPYYGYHYGKETVEHNLLENISSKGKSLRRSVENGEMKLEILLDDPSMIKKLP